ncbi:hypothetical protein HKX48_002616 [Thoreauomyces humboldtii]|nr:hypothetical protein HKX48_002616 [Thoreauomyces humboldtii]
MDPSALIRDQLWNVQDNIAAFTVNFPTVYAAASDADQTMLKTDAEGLTAIVAGITASTNKFMSPVWGQLFNYVRGSPYGPSLEWLVDARSPHPSAALLANYTTPADINSNFGTIYVDSVKLSADVNALLPEALNFIKLGRGLGISITVFTYVRVGGALLYGFSVLDRFDLFSVVLGLHRWLIPAIRAGLIVCCAFSVILLTGIWWANWDYNLSTATNAAHFYVLSLDAIVSSLMVKAILKVRRDVAAGSKAAAGTNGIRVTVPYGQLYGMFGYLVFALVVSIILACLDSVVGPWVRMEMTSYREAVLISGYTVGFRFLSTLRSFRRDQHSQSSLRLNGSKLAASSSIRLPSGKGQGKPMGGHTASTTDLTTKANHIISPENDTGTLGAQSTAGNTEPGPSQV